MPNALVASVTLGISLVALFAFLIVGTCMFKIQFKRNFSIKGDFINEVVTANYRLHLTLSLILVSLAALLVFYFFSFDYKNNPITICVYFSALISVVLFACTIIIPPIFPKHHVVTFVFSNIAYIILISIVIIYFTMQFNYRPSERDDIKKIVVSIISLLHIVYFIGILINPKLLNWAQLNKIVADDGTIVIERPKVFVLALSEWLALIGMFTFPIGILILNLI